MLQIYTYAFQYAMIVWLLYDLWSSLTDPSIGRSDKITFSLIDIASIAFIISSMFSNPKNQGWIYFLSGFLLEGWYVRYLIKDITDPSTTDFQKVLYSSIDFLMIICILGGSMLFTALEKIAIKHGFIDISDTFKLVYNLF